MVVMGIYDRDYERNGGYGQAPGMHLSAPQSMTMQIVVFTACVYLAQMIFGPTGWVNQHLALDARWYMRPWQFYQLLSYGFLHSQHSIQHVLFNMYGLWLFGRAIEQRYGRQEFLSFYLSAIVIAGLIWSASTLLSDKPSGGLIGASGGTVAVMLLFAFNFPHRTLLLMFIFPVPMWVVGCLIVFSDVFGAVNYRDVSQVAFLAHLGGAGYAFLYYRLGWNPGRWLANAYSDISSTRSRSKAKLRIHEPEGVDSKDEESETDQRVDEILKKIQEQGQESLTRVERRVLEKASQEYQRKRR